MVYRFWQFCMHYSFINKAYIIRQYRIKHFGFFFPISMVSKVVPEYSNILATESQQARIIDVLEVKGGVYLHFLRV